MTRQEQEGRGQEAGTQTNEDQQQVRRESGPPEQQGETGPMEEQVGMKIDRGVKQFLGGEGILIED